MLLPSQQALVSVQGPFAAGAMDDGVLFRGGKLNEPRHLWKKESLYHLLPKGIKAIGDSAYCGMPEKVTVSIEGHSEQSMKFINRAKARQENYHHRLKDFAVLGSRFRHGKSTETKMAMHQMCVEAICVIVQFDLQHHPLLEV